MSDAGDNQAVTTAPAVGASSVPAISDVSPITEVPAAASEAAAVPSAEEPQNALTKQFTEEEWAALKIFRTKLPEIWKAAFSPEKDAAEPEPIVLWGITIDPKSPATDARVSVVLMKFLRARELNVDDAQTMLTATLKWRQEFKVDEVMKEQFPDEVFAGVGRIYGTDKGGRPIVYNIYGGGQNIKDAFSDVQRFIRWRVQLMERSIQPLDFETIDQTVQVHDYEGVSIFTGRDANQKAAATEATTIFANHYPELLFKKLFVNVPAVLTWMFWLFKPIISAKTYAKMSVVGTGKETIAPALLPLIDASELPKRYGGEAEGF